MDSSVESVDSPPPSESIRQRSAKGHKCALVGVLTQFSHGIDHSLCGAILGNFSQHHTSSGDPHRQEIALEIFRESPMKWTLKDGPSEI